MLHKNKYRYKIRTALNPGTISPYSIALISVISFVLAAFKVYGISPDDENYDAFFDLARIEGWDTFAATRFEPGFVLITTTISSLIKSNEAVYGLIVALAIFTKTTALKAASKSYWIFGFTTLVYFARYFPFYELTQLRAACAISMLFIAFLHIKNENKWSAFIFCLAATAFHLSSLAIAPFLFINPKKLSTTLIIASATATILHASSQAITSGLANFINVFANYQSQGFGDNTPNPFAITILLDWTIIVYILITWKHHTNTTKHLACLVLIGLAIFYSLLEFAVIAHRLRELFATFLILLIPELLKARTSRTVATAFGTASIAIYSYFFILSSSFFQ